MTLRRPNCEPIALNLEPRSLYVMLYAALLPCLHSRTLPTTNPFPCRGDVRYEYTHEIPANESVWDEERIPRERRISIMFRDVLPAEQNSDDGVRVFKLTEDGAISL